MVEKLNPYLSSLLMTKRCIFFGSFLDFFQILEHLQKLRTKTARNAEKWIFRKAVVSFELPKGHLISKCSFVCLQISQKTYKIISALAPKKRSIQISSVRESK